MELSTIFNLLKENKEKEAHKELAKYLSAVKLSKEDVGHTYAEIASAYLKANNYILKNYNAFLREVVKELRELKATEQSVSAGR